MGEVIGLLLWLCREVSVFRVICKDTVEEEVLRCAEKKLQLEQDICQLQS